MSQSKPHTFKGKIMLAMDDAVEKVRKDLGRTSNSDQVLFADFFWAEVERLAKKKREEAKSELINATCGEKTFKGYSKGDHDIAATGHFSTVVRVSAPRKSFDPDLFISHIVKTFPKVDRHKLVELKAKAYTKGSPSRSIMTTEV